jgi:hypothetical protein
VLREKPRKGQKQQKTGKNGQNTGIGCPALTFAPYCVKKRHMIVCFYGIFADIEVKTISRSIFNEKSNGNCVIGLFVCGRDSIRPGQYQRRGRRVFYRGF